MRLFVYGTLMPGQPYHHLLGPVRTLGRARTAPGFALVDFDGVYPGMVELPGDPGQVTGQLVELDVSDPARLAALDAYEDCPAMYTRAVIALDDGSTATAYVLRPAFARGRRRIASGDWVGR